MPTRAAIPNDGQLASWGAVELFSWGEAAWRWGQDCSDKFALRSYYDKCKDGDVTSCTYVNQKLGKTPE